MTHSLDIRVYYENTDAGGIVYHADYLCFAERGRTEMLRDAGFEHAKLLKETGVAFAVRNLNIDYIAPARLDDMLQVRTEVTSLTGARMEMAQEIYRGEECLIKISLQLACIDEQGRAVRMPAGVKEAFQGE